jgi:NAD(P)-dependent dehydrogenase (short-subunit alcohol dehydrogenase family)
MDNFVGKVAVVTGAASGIGLALATRFAAEGMKVVLADVEPAALAAAESAIRAKGAVVLALRTDVMKEDEVKRLADAAFDAFGQVHVLCSNAGVARGAGAGDFWDIAAQDWNWVLGVNFFGALYGIRHFVPRMLAHGEPGHIVNTASAAGLATGPLTGAPYTISKHGVVALSELLYKNLKVRAASLSASVLCPGWVNTHILDSARNRPAELAAPGATPVALSAQQQALHDAVRGFLENGLQPDEVAARVVDAIRGEQFYIVPVQPDIEAAVALRLEDMRLRRNPSMPAPPG